MCSLEDVIEMTLVLRHRATCAVGPYIDIT